MKLESFNGAIGYHAIYRLIKKSMALILSCAKENVIGVVLWAEAGVRLISDEHPDYESEKESRPLLRRGSHSWPRCVSQCYRGLEKNRVQVMSLMAMANLYLQRHALMA